MTDNQSNIELLLNSPEIPEPILNPGYQTFQDVPPVWIRKGTDNLGNPWTPDMILCHQSAFHAQENILKASKELFGGSQWDSDFTDNTPGLDTITLQNDKEHYWIFRLENQKTARKLLTLRLFASPFSYEDSPLAWTVLDKFLFEIDPLQKLVLPRQVDMAPVIEAWTRRKYFKELNLYREHSFKTKISVFAMVTDAELDHPENTCNCGIFSSCGMTTEALDLRNNRYPFDMNFKYSFRTSFSTILPTGLRVFRLI